MKPEIKILRQLRRQLLVRVANIERRFEAADRARNVWQAAELQSEQRGVSWAIHDLDFIMDGLKWHK